MINIEIRNIYQKDERNKQEQHIKCCIWLYLDINNIVHLIIFSVIKNTSVYLSGQCMPKGVLCLKYLDEI